MSGQQSYRKWRVSNPGGTQEEFALFLLESIKESSDTPTLWKFAAVIAMGINPT